MLRAITGRHHLISDFPAYGLPHNIAPDFKALLGNPY